MKVSENWLREWVKTPLSLDELITRLTMAGLEVDGTLPVAEKFSGVVVGEILSIAPHPDADKLRVCQVAGHSDGSLQVVCGATNARQGLKIPFALVGAHLPSGEEDGLPLQIKAAKLRGVESNGMLCSARELGMESSQDGLLELPEDAPVGQDIRHYLNLDDNLLDINLTPNRGDCLSLRGLARELGVLVASKVKSPEVSTVKPVIQDIIAIEIEVPLQCPRYVCRVVRGVDNSKAAPIWLQEKLRRSGIRSINSVVDVTNYVMLELGQPMHSFDFNKLGDKVNVRLSLVDESILLLDGQKISLKAGSLLIADEKGPLALAGIMGGAESAVSSTTQDILLEAAFFDPLTMAGKAREYGLHTESSFRFERGVDFSLQELAVERATQLLLEITGGQAGPLIAKQFQPGVPIFVPITLRLRRVEEYLGLKLTKKQVCTLLDGLGLELIESNEQFLVFQPPSWRFDLRIEVDLLEEIARIYGYNKLPVGKLSARLAPVLAPETLLPMELIKNRLTSLGYREVITYSFVDPILQGKINTNITGDPSDHKAISIQNPISSEMGVMRCTLLPGLLSTALYNLNRQQSRLRIFENGLVFSSIGGKTLQEPMLGLLLCGGRHPENWFANSNQLIDFYDLKGDVESIFDFVGPRTDLIYKKSEIPALHPGQSASIWRANSYLGWFGALHPALQKALGFQLPVFVGQLHIDALRQSLTPVYREISRFPEVRRDLAVLVGQEVLVSDLVDAARLAAGSYLINLKVFDVYSGEGIDTQRKSVGLGLTFQAKSRTLNESEIAENVDRVVDSLNRHFHAELRS